MASSNTTAPALAVQPGSCEALAASFRRSLLAANRSPRTIYGYSDAVKRFAAFLADQGMPTSVAGIHREHVEAFIADQLARKKPNTANARYRGLRLF